MNTQHAIRVGLQRGWIEFVNSLRSPQDIGFYVFMGLAATSYLFVNRNNEVDGTSLLMPTVALPSLLGAMIVFSAYIGPASALSIEREDGTLLRAKAVPGGMTGFVSGQVLYQSLNVLPLLLILLIPSMMLFDDVTPHSADGWALLIGLCVLGLLAILPMGMIVGSLLKNPTKVGTWGMLPMFLLLGTSGIFYPLQDLWGWVQAVVQVFPMYWLGLGMRSGFLPDEASVIEIGESWRTWETFGVLGAWALVGLVLAPIVLRRMARRQSGSAVEAAKQSAMQRFQ